MSILKKYSNVLKCGTLVEQARTQGILSIRVMWKGMMEMTFELGLRRFSRIDTCKDGGSIGKQHTRYHGSMSNSLFL